MPSGEAIILKPRVLRIGDVHLGNAYTDVVALARLLVAFSDWFGDSINEVIVLGDVIDGMDKYATQSYRQSPEPLMIQRELLKWLTEQLMVLFEKARIIYVIGNHELDARGMLIDVELFEKAYPDVKFVERYVDMDGIVNLHSPPGRGRGSRLVGFTPHIISLLKDVIIEEMRGGYDVKGAAVAHVHKMASMVKTANAWFFLLPSFMVEREDEVISSPFIVATWVERGIIVSFDSPWTPRETRIAANEWLASCVRRNRRQCGMRELLFRFGGRKDSDNSVGPGGGGGEGGGDVMGLLTTRRCKVIYHGGKRYVVDPETERRVRECVERKPKEQCARELRISRSKIYAILNGTVLEMTAC